MFAPPEPKVKAAASAVAPYEANAAEYDRWRKMQAKHHKALTKVVKETDQSVPEMLANQPLMEAKEHARLFRREDAYRKIGENNLKNLDRLGEIILKPGEFGQMMNSEKPKPPPLRAMENQKRQQKAINVENGHLVRRLLTIKGTLDRKAQEKDFQRHSQTVQRLKKLAPQKLKRLGAAQPPRERPHEGAAAAGALRMAVSDRAGEDSPGHDKAFRNSRSRLTLPPLTKQLAGSKSLPSLGSSQTDALAASSTSLGRSKPVVTGGLATPQPVTCDGGHPLTQGVAGSAELGSFHCHQCDVCSSKVFSPDPIWRCNACNFDLCGACHASKASASEAARLSADDDEGSPKRAWWSSGAAQGTGAVCAAGGPGPSECPSPSKAVDEEARQTNQSHWTVNGEESSFNDLDAQMAIKAPLEEMVSVICAEAKTEEAAGPAKDEDAAEPPSAPAEPAEPVSKKEETETEEEEEEGGLVSRASGIIGLAACQLIEEVAAAPLLLVG